ncbi:DUF2511 domain-containing protein [Hymenobacter sp. UYCo722]|uniref:DUF2511 domain-containing protein n=1 Tax=Hymenobacter sp. UYCo722 TaxID=3156335 RepID=UPI003398B941
MRKINFGCLVIFTILLLACKSRLQTSSEDGELITKAKYGRAWPFRTDSLRLFCGVEKEADIYVERKGNIYALNSKASDMADSEEVDAFRPWVILMKSRIVFSGKHSN